jgi:hypothetical protein
MAERLKWVVTRSCGCQYDSLLIGNRDEASVMNCPAGWALRLNRLRFESPGAHEIYRTRELAMKAVEDWFKGLDIVPWD